MSKEGHGNATTLAYQVLKKSILNGEYKQGEALNEKSLSEKMCISRTPLRQAFQLLIKDGLVESISNKGVFISTKTFVEIHELFEIRSALESFAAYKIIEKNLDISNHEIELRKLLADQERALSNHSHLEFIHLDKRFHMKIMEIYGNNSMIEIMNRVRDQLTLVNMNAIKFNDKFAEGVLNEHQKIIDELVSENIVGVIAALDEHGSKSIRRNLVIS